MQKPKKRHLIIGGALLAASLVGASGGLAKAASQNQSFTSMNGLAKAIAQKFSLNEADVQKVVEEQHIQMRAEMQAKHEQTEKDFLAQAVKDGKLTQDQADKITAKHAELKASRTANKEAFKNKTESERKTMMQQEREGLTKWLTDNNIPQEYFKPHFGKGMGGPGHKMGGMKHMEDIQPK
jgi:flagellar biosynthesis GTPase FlhF